MCSTKSILVQPRYGGVARTDDEAAIIIICISVVDCFTIKTIVPPTIQLSGSRKRKHSRREQLNEFNCRCAIVFYKNYLDLA